MPPDPALQLAAYFVLAPDEGVEDMLLVGPVKPQANCCPSSGGKTLKNSRYMDIRSGTVDTYPGIRPGPLASIPSGEDSPPLDGRTRRSSYLPSFCGGRRLCPLAVDDQPEVDGYVAGSSEMGGE